MIVEWGYSVVGSLVRFLFSFMPEVDSLEAIALQLDTVFDPLSSALNGLGGWIPWGTVNTCVTITLGFWLATLVLRVVKSFLPTISG